MSEAELLAAVVADPDDDAARLVLSDALLARGDPRGELIAVQCQLARLDDRDPAWPKLARRQARLLKAHAARWAAPFETSAVTFRRGFVERLTVGAVELMGSAGFLAREPVEAVETNANLPALFGSPVVRRLRELRLWADHDLVGLASSTLPRLERLRLTSGQAEALLALPLAARLRALAVPRCPDRALPLPALEELEVSAGIPRGLPLPPTLRRLAVGSSDEPAALIARLPALDALDLGASPIDAGTAAALVASQPVLRRLAVRLTDAEAAAALAAGLPALEELTLDETRVDVLDAIADAAWRLRALTVTGPGVGAALAAGAAFRALTRLTCRRRVSVEDIASIAAASWPVLHTIELHVARGVDAERALAAAAPRMPHRVTTVLR
jgi:uncharacterized protein (TIGR02996 family)